MKKILCAGLFCALICGAAEFRNLIVNPDFRFGKDQNPYDYDWNDDISQRIRFKTDKDGGSIVELLPDAKSVTFKQQDIQLKIGGKYRIGAVVRTRGFKAKRSGVIFYNYAWMKGVGTPHLPADTNGWKTIEADVTAPDSRYSMFTACVYTVGHSAGTLEIKSLWLRALDKESDQIAHPSPAASTIKRITPISPLLSAVDSRDAKVLFSFRYPLADPEKAYFCRASIRKRDAEKSAAAAVFPLEKGRIQTSFGRVDAGKWRIRVELIHRVSGKIIAANEYPFTASVPAAVSGKPERRLNSLVVRLLTAPAKEGEYRFSMPRDGWIFIHLDRGAPGTRAYLDGASEPVLIHREGEAYETFRNIRKGDHRLRLENSVGGGRLIINSIPEIVASPYPWIPPKNERCEFYHGQFLRDYLYPAITTFNHGYSIAALPKDVYADFASRGKEWFALGVFNSHLKFYQTPDEISAYLKKRMADSRVDGLAFDEVTSYWIWNKLLFTDVLWRNLETEKPIYTWSAGYNYKETLLNTDFLSAVRNASGGKGCLLLEYYAQTEPTGKQAAAQIASSQNETIRRIEKMVPGFRKNAFFILGIYTRPGDYLKLVHPQVDVKKFWDMYFRNLATGKDFEDLRGIGIYAFPNGNEESLRWAARVIRHYAIEGKVDSLADQYGYTYLPGHVVNGDFDRGLESWKAEPAAKNSIRPMNQVKYGQGIQKRTGKIDTLGDNVCVFTRSEKAPNHLSQMMKGFTPGKLYVLRFTVADAAEVANKKPDGKLFAFRALLDGAEVVTDRTHAGKYGRTLDISGNRYLNVHTLVFKALKPEVELRFTDWRNDKNPDGPIKQSLLLNFIQVTPYFAE